MSGFPVSRREVLSGLGVVGVASVLGSGTVAASPTGRYIVGTSTRGASDEARRRAESVHRVLEFGSIGQAVSGRFSQQALENLARNPNVRYIEADGEMRAISIDSSDGEVPWGVDRVDAEKAHAAGSTGRGAHIAIIDTGIDSDHPDLQSTLGTGRAFVKARGPYAEPWDDDAGHGTHCAGTANAVDDGAGVVGVSTEATLHAVKVLDKNGSGAYSDVAAGIKWVGDQGYDVGSLSLGGGTSQTIRDACQYAYDRDVLLVAAAGNSSADVEGFAPATYSTVMAVSATDSDDAFASFSNYGSDIEIAAPGVDIYSTYPGGGYATLSGTSMACPHVSGAAGQLRAQGYGRDDARTRLRDTAEDIGLSTSQQGSGLLDVEAALSGSLDAAPSVSWQTPSGGETLSGELTVQITASDTEDADDSLDVSYTVDGGSARPAAYNVDTGYYEDEWDTATVDDGEVTLVASAMDSAGTTSTASVSVTVDNVESAPVVDSLSLSEVETEDADAEFDAVWSVSDSDGNLESGEFVLVRDSDGTTVDTEPVPVSGATSDGTIRLVAPDADGSGQTYTATLTVTDGAGKTGSATASETETEVTNVPPSVDSVQLTSDSNPAWTRYYVDWSVSDGNGNLASVTTELVDASGTVVATDSSSFTGTTESASGTHYVETKGAASSLVVTATDSDGQTDAEPRSV